MRQTVNSLRRTKARLLGTAAEDIPVTFQLTCECGHVVEGTRRTSWQEAVCGECQTTHFVLPVNVYPATTGVASEVIGGSFIHRLTTVVSELLPAKPPPESRRGTSPETQAAAETAVADTSHSRFRLPRPTFPKIDPIGFLRRTFTPLRLLMLAMASIVVATSAWMIHQRRLENARQSWRTSLDLVAGLLEDRDIVGLEGILHEAVSAGRTLSYDDAEFRRVSNLFEETAAINAMGLGDLLNTLFGAYTDEGILKTDAAEGVRQNAVGQVFVFDSQIRPMAGARPSFAIDLPIVAPGGAAINIRIFLPALRELLGALSDRRCLFAAEVGHVSGPTENADGAWQIELQAEKFVLLTSDVLCGEIGLQADSDETLQGLLRQQQDFVETSLHWGDRNQTIAETVSGRDAP